MEDFQSHKIYVKSKINDYDVLFTNDIRKIISEVCAIDDLIVVDKNIYKYFPDVFDNLESKILLIEASEISKTYDQIEKTIGEIISLGFRKNNKLIAVGGGITQDIVSFVASILFRGVKWIFIPTNLLSQCDSCIGSKLSVNFRGYKNLLGGFYPPEAIFIDYRFLKTLNQEEILSGLGEMLHYFLLSSIKDSILFLNKAPIIKTDINEIGKLIERSLEIKKSMIEIDEFDKGPRNIFNYGHTFGHALESVLNFSVPHGICVSFGIDLANLISYDFGFITMDQRNFIRSLCMIVYDGVELPKIDIEEYENALKKDKKNIGDNLGLILTKGIGHMFKKFTSFATIEGRIHSYFTQKQYLFDL